MLDTLEHLAAPGKRSNGTNYTILGDLLAQAAYSARPDGYPTSSSTEGVVLTKPASQPYLRTHPDEPLAPPHEQGFVTDTSVERIAEERANDVCDDCYGHGFVARTVDSPDTVPCQRCNGTGRRWADPIGEAARDVVAALMEMRRFCAIVQRKSDIVLHAADNHRGRQSTLGGNCDVCTEFVTGVGDDKLKSKLCPRCQLKHGGWKVDHPTSSDPGADRLAFKKHMQEWLAAEASKPKEREAVT
jgi:hypothetical protein